MLFEGRVWILDALGGIFSIKIEGTCFSDVARVANISDHPNLKIWTPE